MIRKKRESEKEGNGVCWYKIAYASKRDPFSPSAGDGMILLYLFGTNRLRMNELLNISTSRRYTELLIERQFFHGKKIPQTIPTNPLNREVRSSEPPSSYLRNDPLRF